MDNANFFMIQMENGQWTMDNGQWKMENEKWKMSNGQRKHVDLSVWSGRTMGNGQWVMDNEKTPTFFMLRMDKRQ